MKKKNILIKEIKEPKEIKEDLIILDNISKLKANTSNNPKDLSQIIRSPEEYFNNKLNQIKDIHVRNTAYLEIHMVLKLIANSPSMKEFANKLLDIQNPNSEKIRIVIVNFLHYSNSIVKLLIKDGENMILDFYNVRKMPVEQLNSLMTSFLKIKESLYLDKEGIERILASLEQEEAYKDKGEYNDPNDRHFL